jgi:hypothetical protein
VHIDISSRMANKISIDKKCPLKAMMFDVYYNLKNIKHADHMKCIYAYIERNS